MFLTLFKFYAVIIVAYQKDHQGWVYAQTLCLYFIYTGCFTTKEARPLPEEVISKSHYKFVMNFNR